MSTPQLPRNLLWRASLDAWNIEEGAHAASAKWHSQRAAYVQQRDAVAELLRVQPAAPPLPDRQALQARPVSPDPLSELCAAAADEQAASAVAAAVLAEICKDTRRTFQTNAWFAVSASPNEAQGMLERLLLTWAFRYPSISYRQGMSQLAGVILHAIRGDHTSAASFSSSHISPDMRHLVDLALDHSQLEADAFSLFELLLNHVVCYFEDSCSSKPSRPSASAESDEGSRLFQILGRHSQMLKEMDYELYRKLAHSEIEPAFYMLRWVRALFSQDFHLDQIVQIWDALICAPNGLDSVPVFCLAMLEYIRFEILGAHGFLVLRALSGYPTLVTVSPLIGLFRQLQAAVQKGDVLLDFSPAASSSGIRVPQSASLFPHVHVSRRALPHTRLRIVSGAKRPETAIKSVSDDDFRVPRAATQGGIRRIESAPSLSSLALPLAPPPAPRLSAPFHAMPQIISEEVAELFEELPVWQPHGSLPSTVLVREASRSFSPPAEAADPCSMQTLPAVSVHEPEKFEGPAASLLRGYSELVFEWIDPAPIPLLESTAIHSELPSHALPPLPRSSSVSNLSSASLQTRPLQLTPFIDHVSLASTAERNVTLAAKTLARTHHSLNSSSFSPRAVQHDARLIPARVSNVPVVHVKHVAIPSARALTSHMRSSSSPSLSALVQSSASAAAHVVQPHCRNLFDAAALSSHSPSTDGVFAVHSPPRALRKSAFSSSFGSLSTLAESPLSDARVSTELFASSHRIDSLFAPDSKAASELDSDDEAACRSAAVLVDAAHVVIDESFFALKQSDSPTPHSPAHQHHHSHHHIDLLLTDSDPLVPLSSAWPHESGAAHLSLHAEPPSSFALRHDAEAAAPVHVKSPSQLPPPSVSVRFDNALAIGARFTADAAESEPRAPSPASGSEDASRVVGVDIEEDCEFADEISSSGFAFRYRGYLVLFDRVAHSAATVLRRVYVKIKNGALQIFANSQCADRLDSIPLAACVVHVAPVAEASPDLMHPIALAPVAPAVAHGGDTGTADLVAKETAPSSVAAAAAAAPLAAVSASASTAVERTPFCFHVQLSAPSGGGRDRLAFFARSRDELTRWVGSLQLASSIPLNDLGTSEIHRVIALLSDL